MSYQDPKNFKKWGGILDPEDETDPNLPLFNWDDVDLAQPVPSEPKPIEKTFSVKVDRKQVRYTAIKKEERVTLFSHVKKIYTIEITATKEAIKQYFKNKNNYVGIK